VTIRSFQIRNLLLWTGVTTAGLVTVSLLGTGPLALPGIIVSWCIRSWLASSILGSAAVIAIRRVTGDAHTDTPSHKAEHAVGSRFLSAVKHVAGWFSRTVRRAAHMASAYTASYTRQPE
jgi:hypothetical protein